MRVAVGGLSQESNTFVPMKSDLEVFRARTLVRGDAVLDFARRTRVELTGFLDVLARGGAAPMPEGCRNSPPSRYGRWSRSSTLFG